jgi:hypothetical protein
MTASLMLTGVLVFLLVIIALMAIPITLTFQFSWPSTPQENALLEWGFGLVKVRVPASEPKAHSSGKNSYGKNSYGTKTNLLPAVRLKSFRRRIARFVGDLWRAIHKEDLSLRVRVGLGDPADTGQLWAIVGPIAGMLTTVQGAAIAIEPEFSESTFELNSAGSIRLIPLQLIWLTIALLLSPPIWQGLAKMRNGGR